MTDREYIKSDMKAFMKELLESLKGQGYSPYLKSKDNPQGKTDGLTPKTLNKILMKIAKGEDNDEVLESLRDWFKKEKWVRISSSGNIAGPCGTSKNKKNPDRCLPKAKAQSLSKAQRAATARKKKKAGAKGKTVVKNTKAAKVTRENHDRSWSREDMEIYIDETLGGYLERYLGYNPGPPNHPMYKMSHEQFAAYIAQEMIDGIDELLDGVDTSIEFLRDVIEDAYEERKKIAMGVGHDPDMHFEPEEEKIGADALELVLQTLDKMATPTKLETANPQDGKAAPYGSGYKPIKKMKK